MRCSGGVDARDVRPCSTVGQVQGGGFILGTPWQWGPQAKPTCGTVLARPHNTRPIGHGVEAHWWSMSPITPPRGYQCQAKATPDVSSISTLYPYPENTVLVQGPTHPQKNVLVSYSVIGLRYRAATTKCLLSSGQWDFVRNSLKFRTYFVRAHIPVDFLWLTSRS